jgi:hypothetical protein
VKALRLKIAGASSMGHASELVRHLNKWSISTRQSQGYLYMRYNPEEISICMRGEERTIGQLFDLAFHSVGVAQHEDVPPEEVKDE